MPRIIKHPTIRRNELLDVAQSLFFESGYERATIADIIEKAGISKGGFYHHFSSKEEVLEALAARLAQESSAKFNDILDCPDLDALSRLNAFFARSRQIKIEEAPKLWAMFEVLYKPGNIVLYHRINAAVIPMMVPALARVIQQGREEGVFHVPDAEATAELIYQFSISTHDIVARAMRASGTPEESTALDALEERVRFLGIALDRILGLPDGSIVFTEPGFIRKAMGVRR